MTITCRLATKEDLREILALYAQPDIDDGNVLSLADAERVLDRMSSYPDYTLYISVEGDVIVGTLALLIMDNLGHIGSPSAVIEDVVVDPSRHGQGIGTIMMKSAIDIARAKGCYKAVLSSNVSREKAHAFYETLGFERHGYSYRMNLHPVASP